MNNYKNSRTTVSNQEFTVAPVVKENARPADVARDLDISVRTVHKWLRHHRNEGSVGLENRSRAAITLRHKLPSAYEELIMYLRRSFRMSTVTLPESSNGRVPR